MQQPRACAQRGNTLPGRNTKSRCKRPLECGSVHGPSTQEVARSSPAAHRAANMSGDVRSSGEGGPRANARSRPSLTGITTASPIRTKHGGDQPVETDHPLCWAIFRNTVSARHWVQGPSWLAGGCCRLDPDRRCDAQRSVHPWSVVTQSTARPGEKRHAGERGRICAWVCRARVRAGMR